VRGKASRKGEERRTGKVELANEVVHLGREASARHEVRQGVQAVDDLGQVLGVIQVDRLEAEDLRVRARGEREQLDDGGDDDDDGAGRGDAPQAGRPR